MSVNYDKLWILLIKNKMKKTELKDRLGLSTNVLANLSKNKYVSVEVLEKICLEFDVTFDDIVKIVKEEKE